MNVAELMDALNELNSEPEAAVFVANSDGVEWNATHVDVSEGVLAIRSTPSRELPYLTISRLLVNLDAAPRRLPVVVADDDGTDGELSNVGLDAFGLAATR